MNAPPYMHKWLHAVLLFFLLGTASAKAEVFGVGETLRYKIKYLGLLTVGYAEMSIPGTIRINGSPCLVFSTKTTGTDFVNAFYPIDDGMVSHWDPLRKRVVWSEKRINEGSFHREYQASFDYSRKTVFWKQKGYAENSSGQYVAGSTESIPPLLHDMLSVVQFCRIYDAVPKAGNSYSFVVFDDLTMTELTIDILRKETVVLEINHKNVSFEAIVIKPQYSTTGLFQFKGELLIWIADDEQRLPLKISVETMVGRATAELYTVE